MQMLRRMTSRTPLSETTSSVVNGSASGEAIARSEVEKLRELNRILVKRLHEMKTMKDAAKSSGRSSTGVSPMVMQTPLTGKDGPVSW